MTRADRLNRVADGLAKTSRSLLIGSSIMALAAMVYGGQTGLAGDAFVAFAQEAGTNLAILLFAVMILASLFGAMVIVYFVIALVVNAPRMLRALRRTPSITR